jgi:hypothetical protein
MVFLLFNGNDRVTENPKPQNQNEKKTQKIKTEAAVEPQIVSLNVGGSLFSTTTSTLLNVPTTFFPEMLKKPPGPQGWYFIDRTPENFHIILEYLRNGVIQDLDPERLSIASELNYFGFQSFIHNENLPYNINYINILKVTDLNKREFSNFIKFKSQFTGCKLSNIGKQLLSLLCPKSDIKILNTKGEVKFILKNHVFQNEPFVGYTNDHFITAEKSQVIVWKKSSGNEYSKASTFDILKNYPKINMPEYCTHLVNSAVMTPNGVFAFCYSKVLKIVPATKYMETRNVQCKDLMEFSDGTFANVFSHEISYFDINGEYVSSVKNGRFQNIQFYDGIIFYLVAPGKILIIDSNHRFELDTKGLVEGGLFKLFIVNGKTFFYSGIFLFVFEKENVKKIQMPFKNIQLEDGSFASVEPSQIKVYDLKGKCPNTLVSLSGPFTDEDLLFFQIYKNQK